MCCATTVGFTQEVFVRSHGGACVVAVERNRAISPWDGSILSNSLGLPGPLDYRLPVAGVPGRQLERVCGAIVEIR